LSTDVDLSGWVLDHYRLERPIRNELLGRVYHATDVRAGKSVAIKVLTSRAVADRKLASRFRQEVELSQRIGSDNLVKSYSVGSDQGFQYIVMELFAGNDLLQSANEEPKPTFDLERFSNVVRQICRALQDTLDHGVIHGNITPASILEAAGGLVKLTDLGAAIELSGGEVAQDTVSEPISPEYTSPEQWNGSPVDFRADIYALGCTLYRWATGQPLFPDRPSSEDMRRAHCSELPRSPIDVAPSIAPWASDLITCMVAKNMAARPSAYREIIGFVDAGDEAPVPNKHHESVGADSLELEVVYADDTVTEEEPEDGRQLAVCPRCGYGFVGGESVVYECTNPACGYEWTAVDAIEISAYSARGRVACPELWMTQASEHQTFALKEGENVIGRRPGCAVCLPNLRVSRRHAAVTRRGGSCVLADLNSSTGTVLNGRRIDGPERLYIGDSIVIAGITFEYRVRYESGAGREESGGDEHAIAAAGKLRIKVAGGASNTIPLTSERVTLGRSDECDVILPFTMVSAKHARITRDSEGVYVLDLKSANGTFVNGRRIIRQRLEKDDRLQIGPFLFTFEGASLRRETSLDEMELDAIELEVDVIVRGGDRKRILDDVSLTIRPGELTGLIGPSGSGKSTLLNALCGLRPADHGQVLINGESLYRSYDSYRTRIGYVPQDDIVHEELAVEQALQYAARLRLPQDTSREERRTIIDETLGILGMDEERHSLIGDLSGGQRKRVSIGVELLAKPRLLFLDEPTSGLDPATEARLMTLFRKLADRGHAVICSTHVMENVDLFDNVVVLVKGRLAFCGEPSTAKAYFNVDRMVSLYDRLAEKSASEWKQDFLASGHAPVLRLPEDSTDSRNVPSPLPAPAGQLLVLTARYLATVLADRKNVFLLILQPVLVSLVICLACPDISMVLFLAVVSVLWFGSSNAAKEIVKEAAVYVRERMVNLNIAAYVGSKLVVLAAIAACQCTIVLVIISVLEDGVSEHAMIGLALFLTSIAGTTMGLFISAISSNVTKAITAIPLVLIPQIILAGAIVPLGDMNPGIAAVSYVTTTRWANQACEVLLVNDKKIDAGLLGKYPRPLQNLYPGYSIVDRRDAVRFLGDMGGHEIDKNRTLAVDLLTVAILAALGFVLSIIGLRAKEVRRR